MEDSYNHSKYALLEGVYTLGENGNIKLAVKDSDEFINILLTDKEFIGDMVKKYMDNIYDNQYALKALKLLLINIYNDKDLFDHVMPIIEQKLDDLVWKDIYMLLISFITNKSNLTVLEKEMIKRISKKIKELGICESLFSIINKKQGISYTSEEFRMSRSRSRSRSRGGTKSRSRGGTKSRSRSRSRGGTKPSSRYKSRGGPKPRSGSRTRRRSMWEDQ